MTTRTATPARARPARAGRSSDLVRDWMASPAITATSDMRVSEAQAIMRERHIRRLPVLDQFGKLAGIVTRVDLGEARPSGADAMSFSGVQIAMRMMTLGEVMTRNPVTIAPGASVCRAVKLMLKHHISGLPVVEGGHVVGVIADSDIFRKFAADCG